MAPTMEKAFAVVLVVVFVDRLLLSGATMFIICFIIIVFPFTGFAFIC